MLDLDIFISWRALFQLFLNMRDKASEKRFLQRTLHFSLNVFLKARLFFMYVWLMTVIFLNLSKCFPISIYDWLSWVVWGYSLSQTNGLLLIRNILYNDHSCSSVLIRTMDLYWAVQMSFNSHSPDGHINILHCTYRVCFLYTFLCGEKHASWEKWSQD